MKIWVLVQVLVLSKTGELLERGQSRVLAGVLGQSSYFHRRMSLLQGPTCVLQRVQLAVGPAVASGHQWRGNRSHRLPSSGKCDVHRFHGRSVHSEWWMSPFGPCGHFHPCTHWGALGQLGCWRMSWFHFRSRNEQRLRDLLGWSGQIGEWGHAGG